MEKVINKIKEFWTDLSPLVRKGIIVIGIFIIILIFMALISSCSNNVTNYTYENFNTYLVNTLKSVYKDNPDINQSKSININEIISPEKYLVDNTTCTGDVTITNNNGYILYTPKVTCGSNTYNLLKDKVIKDNTVTSGNGLYNVNGTYIFKGSNVNNYIMIDDVLFRIIRINSDGTLKLIDMKTIINSTWDSRYNVDKETTTGVNNFYANGLSSAVKDALDEAYKDDTYSDSVKAYFTKTSLCVGKRSVNDNVLDENIDCAVKVDDSYLGLIVVSDYYLASLDANCTTYESKSCVNDNYMANIGSSWTLNADKDSTDKAYKLTNGINLSSAISSGRLKIVVNIDGNVLVSSGDGSKENPYKIG